jgi:hypothetical protein
MAIGDPSTPKSRNRDLQLWLAKRRGDGPDMPSNGTPSQSLAKDGLEKKILE